MFYWDPNPEVFLIPYFNWPILWYGLLFTIGFALGFPIFVSILRRFFFSSPEYIEPDILCPDKLTMYGKKIGVILKHLNEIILCEQFGSLPGRIQKYVKKSCCLHPGRVLARLKLDIDLGDAVLGIYRKAVQVTDRFVLYILIGTILGARLGHYLFYENPSVYLRDPLEIFRIWQGGLASHGAAIGIIIAVWIFSHRMKKIVKGLNWIRLLDFVSVPTALCGFFIRIGNFVNQEIFGRETSLPWAVVFGHPIDHSPPAARHPTQIYEALFYLLVFLLLWRLTYRCSFLLKKGRLIGLFLVLVFVFRFFIEFLKVEQSHLVSSVSIFTMGQILSIPMICLGLFFFFLERNRLNNGN